ncbi:hypothetical protein [Streptomyces lavendofoliae]|uniref:hypothetical protein n=1 Tax=Streptomyces lavendofoliae TaxID=67314 RepID=UPI003D8BB09A
MAREEWTVDRLHHALPHSALRQQLLADVNLTPIDELPAVLARWAAAAEALEAAAPRIEAARADLRPGRGPHGGHRPGRQPPWRAWPGSGVTYRLHLPGDIFDTYKQLPDPARRDLAVFLVDA